jgi:hypothetical protein
MHSLFHPLRALRAALATPEPLPPDVAHEVRQQRRRGAWPPPTARDLQAREMLAGNWRPR